MSLEFKSIGYWFFPLSAVFLSLLGVFVSPLWSVAPIVWLMIIVPGLDFLFKKLQHTDMPANVTQSYTGAIIFVCLCIFASFFCALFQMAQFVYSFEDVLLLGFGFGIVSGTVGMTAAHELIHRKNKLLYRIGSSHLIFCLYGHYPIEHIYGHHMNVGKASDPATARFGENLYRFLVRCIVMRVESAWWIERKRLERKELPIVSLHNRLIVSWLLQVLLILLSGLIFGKSGVAFLLIHSVVAICFLESVEYLEHYGLKRKKTTENASIFEPLNHGHAWTTRNKVAAWCSFNLGLHSDHHLYGTKQYPMLNTQKTEREMPFNYTVMLLMAMLPPLWFSVMNKKLVNNSV